LKKGWINQRDIIKQCFDKIPCEGETVSSIAIGTGLVGVLSGADYSEIINGMKASETKIVLYTV
jgi:butyrate kinase